MKLTSKQRDDLQSVSSSVEKNIWTRFIGQDCVMYDFTGPDGPDGSAFLPTPEECAANKPNALAWWSPIENGGFFNGVYLLALLGRYKRRPEQQLQERIRRLVKGLYLLQDVGSTPGFISRGVGSDGRCHYPASSNDQNMPWLTGLWKYMESDIPSTQEKEECRSRLLNHLGALKAANWVIPGDQPGFERGSMLSEENDLECGLSSVHITFCTKLLAMLAPNAENENLYTHHVNQKLKNGLHRHEVLARGFPDFKKSHGWFTCNSQFPLRELARMETDSFLQGQYRRGLAATGNAAAETILAYKDYDKNEEYRFTHDWRTMLSAWKEQRDTSEAVAVALAEISVWQEASPRIEIEKNTLMASMTAAWLVMMSGDDESIDKWLPEMLNAISWFDYDTMCYSTFFYVENLIQEILAHCCNWDSGRGLIRGAHGFLCAKRFGVRVACHRFSLLTCPCLSH